MCTAFMSFMSIQFLCAFGVRCIFVCEAPVVRTCHSVGFSFRSLNLDISSCVSLRIHLVYATLDYYTRCSLQILRYINF